MSAASALGGGAASAGHRGIIAAASAHQHRPSRGGIA